MRYPSLIFLLSSFLVIIFLFYIDEGKYHLEGVLKPANLVPLGIYFIGIFAAQLFLFRLFKHRTGIWMALMIGLLLGSIIGVMLIAGFFVGLSALRTIG